MKPKIKNIILIILIVCIFIAGVFTANLAKKSVSNNSEVKNEERQNPPDGMGNSNEPNNSNNGSNDNTQNNEEKSGEEQNPNSNITPPSNMPSGNTPPSNTPPNNMGDMMNKNSSNVSGVYYILLSLEALSLSALITYLIMSNFNKKNMKETFKNGDKISIFILTVIILSASYMLLNMVYIKSLNNSSNSNNNAPGATNNSSNVTYSADTKITEDASLSDKNYSSSKEDNNAVLIAGDIDVSLKDITVSKTGDSSSGDNTSFYGMNSALLVKDKAKLTISNANITTNATGANGVFSYGGSATTNNSNSDGTTVTISDSTITTKKDNSGGIMTTGGGITKATNLTINTYGVSSAAIRTDRGGGTVTVNKGTYQTYGAGSPSIYSTADITVNDAKLISNASEGIVIEGKNKVEIKSVELTDTNNKLNGQSTTYKNIFLYQSVSGDAENGTATFTSEDSTITTNNGDSFYVTNTSAIINLTNNKIINNDSNSNFLRIKKDSWGKEGENGGDVTLNLSNQSISGNIVVDSISTLVINMKNNSYYEGALNSSNTAKKLELNLDKTSKIKLTSNLYVTSLTNEVSDNSNIDFNGYKLYVNNKSIN